MFGSHFVESYNAQYGQWAERQAAGLQPSLPFTSISFLVCANVFYLTVTVTLYAYMKARKQPFACRPFKSILMVYNCSCVLLAGYVVFGLGRLLAAGSFRFVCNRTVIPGSADDDGNAALVAHIFWVFYAQKFWEFLDTWFFILRKSFRQVTFLHVFHHCSINLVVGIIVPFEFNGDMYLPIFLNGLVHVLMYSHYLVAALGLSTPWKPYLTSMQLIQFCAIATQSAVSLSRGDTCGAPYFGKILMVGYMASMLLLFGHFFFNAYIRKVSGFGGGVVKRLEPVQITKSHTGRVLLGADGSARVELPSWFSGGEIHYQITPIGRPMPNLHIKREPVADDCSFELAGGEGRMPVSWTVTMVVTLLGQKPKPAPSCCGSSPQDPQGLCCSSPHGTNEDKKER